MRDAGAVAFGAGEAMILAATLLWALEVIFVKRARLGSRRGRSRPRAWASARVVLAGLGRWCRGARASSLGLGAEQWPWALLTGSLLTAYVATWYAALARAQAVDVTAVLVFGAVVTAAARRASTDGVPVDPRRRRPRSPRAAGSPPPPRFAAGPGLVAP